MSARAFLKLFFDTLHASFSVGSESSVSVPEQGPKGTKGEAGRVNGNRKNRICCVDESSKISPKLFFFFF